MGKHAIIVIKKDNKYLQYKDERWNSYLFPNCKLDDTDNLSTVIIHISNILNIPVSNITASLVGTKTHTKFSESAQINKEYTHEFYLVNISSEYELPINYVFMSYEDMLNNERIMETNSDIVDFVKEFNL